MHFKLYKVTYIEHSSAQGTINNVLIILKYYIYVCRCKCRDPDLEDGLEFLKYAINIEKASMIYLYFCSVYYLNGC
jgi:tRNA U38,U39,U40 pseudouridine synthase TruA